MPDSVKMTEKQALERIAKLREERIQRAKDWAEEAADTVREVFRAQKARPEPHSTPTKPISCSKHHWQGVLAGETCPECDCPVCGDGKSWVCSRCESKETGGHFLLCLVCRETKRAKDVLNGICSLCEVNAALATKGASPEITVPSPGAPERTTICLDATPKNCDDPRHPPECDGEGLNCGPAQLRCKTCDREIYMGNCCGEACTKEWEAKLHFPGEAPRLCRNCGSPHEMKSNWCSQCNDLNKICGTQLATSVRHDAKKWLCSKPKGHKGPHSERPCYHCGGPIEDTRPNCYSCRKCDQR